MFAAGRVEVYIETSASYERAYSDGSFVAKEERAFPIRSNFTRFAFEVESGVTVGIVFIVDLQGSGHGSGNCAFGVLNGSGNYGPRHGLKDSHRFRLEPSASGLFCSSIDLACVATTRGTSVLAPVVQAERMGPAVGKSTPPER